MQEIRQVAAAIDLRVRQLEAQGIKGPAIADHMVGYMAGLQRIYDTASDEILTDLCHRYRIGGWCGAGARIRNLP